MQKCNNLYFIFKIYVVKEYTIEKCTTQCIIIKCKINNQDIMPATNYKRITIHVPKVITL